jgi:hypothetical protein
MKHHENDDPIIEGELGSSCSCKKLASGDVGFHQFLFLELAHTTVLNKSKTMHTQNIKLLIIDERGTRLLKPHKLTMRNTRASRKHQQSWVKGMILLT